MTPLIEPKEISVAAFEKEPKTFIVSKLPAIDGREVALKYPVSNVPKLGDYEVSKEIMLKLLSYVAVVDQEGRQIQLSTEALVNNHVPDAEVLFRLEAAMIDYNFGFFRRAAALDSLKELKDKAAPWITKILTALSEQSSANKPQP